MNPERYYKLLSSVMDGHTELLRGTNYSILFGDGQIAVKYGDIIAIYTEEEARPWYRSAILDESASEEIVALLGKALGVP